MYDWVLKKKGIKAEDGVPVKKEDETKNGMKTTEEPRKDELMKMEEKARGEEEPKPTKLKDKHNQSIELKELNKQKLAMLSQTFDSKF